MLKHNIPVFTVSRTLGHSKPSVTLDIYAHMIPGMQDQVARVMDEVITPIPIDPNKLAPENADKKNIKSMDGDQDHHRTA